MCYLIGQISQGKGFNSNSTVRLHNWHKVGLTLDVRYSHIYGPSLKLHAILVYTFLTSITFEQNDLQS